MTDPLLLEIPEEMVSERLTLRMPRVGHQQQVFESTHASLPELALPRTHPHSRSARPACTATTPSFCCTNG